MPPSRVPALALAADIVAVAVFAAIGRASHSEPDSIVGLVLTAAPFLVGLGAAWACPVVRVAPAGFRAGAVVLLGTAALGFLIRFGFTGRLPLSFVLVATSALAVLLLGWRALAALTSRHLSASRHPAG